MSMARKPIIGITCNYEETDRIGILTDMGVSEQKWGFLAQNYIDAVERAGGIPLIIPICAHVETVQALLEQVDGVLISGGNDIAPSCYGEEASPECGVIVPSRDRQDLWIIRYIVTETQKPLLGVCRGAQALNAAFGGTLYQDLGCANYAQHAHDSSPMNREVHRVSLTPGSRIYSAMQAESAGVNSYHHSAVKQVAEGFVPTAVSADGVVEAIEKQGDRFVVAVQWHPEMMYDAPQQQNLFADFVKACG